MTSTAQRIATELRVKVKVVEIDLKRRRIALTMKLGEPAPRQPAAPRPIVEAPKTSMGAAFTRLSK